MIKKKILFSDEDEYDDFYEKYNYELDEQDKETQYKSIKDLDDISRMRYYVMMY